MFPFDVEFSVDVTWPLVVKLEIAVPFLSIEEPSVCVGYFGAVKFAASLAAVYDLCPF